MAGLSECSGTQKARKQDSWKSILMVYISNLVHSAVSGEFKNRVSDFYRCFSPDSDTSTINFTLFGHGPADTVK